MRVAVLCEFSGIVRNAFTDRGHYAVSCDLLPSETQGNHIQGDCRKYSWSDYDLVIAHPDCTYMANSGARWLYEKTGRWALLEKAVWFFNWCLSIPVKYLCVENPIMHKHAKGKILKTYSQIIHPWQFGHGETKATCLWLTNLPLLKPVNIVSGREQRVHKEPPSPDRGKNRSRTYKGIAEAMADQWGCLL